MTLRIPSLISGLALVGLAGCITARWTGSIGAGLLAAVLVALDRNCIFYSQEARPYAALQLVAWCHAAIVWELADRATLRLRAVFVLGAVLQFYLHYTSALFLLGELVFLFDRILDRQPAAGYRGRLLAWDLAGIGLAALPAVPHLREIAARRQQWEQLIQQPLSIQDFWHTFRLEAYLLPWLALLAAWYLLRARREAESQGEQPALRKPLLFVATLLVVPGIVGWVATRRQWAALFLTRYLVSSLVAAPLAAAMGCRTLPSRWMRALAASLTLAATIWSFGIWRQWQLDGRIVGDRRQDWRSAVALVNQQAAPNSVCYVRSGFLEEAGLRQPHSQLLDDYCLAPVNSLYRLRVRAIPITSPREPARQQPEAPERWLLINGSPATRQRFLEQLGAFHVQQEFGELLVARAKDEQEEKED
jgi:hypothetical protein